MEMIIKLKYRLPAALIIWLSCGWFEVWGFQAPETVKIVRDRWGIAHVFASSDEGACFGAGYATAQDRMYSMHRARRAVQGRLAELVGAQGSSGKSIIDQDKNMRYRAFYSYAKRHAERLDLRTKRALLAYSQGVNRYIDEHAADLSQHFEGKIPEEWIPADCLAVWDRLADFFSGFPADEAQQLHRFEELLTSTGSVDGAIKAMKTAVVYDEDAAVVRQEDFTPAMIQAIQQYAAMQGRCDDLPTNAARSSYGPSPKFSHAWVVGGKRLTTGAAALCSDPQTLISAPGIWYEIHMRGATIDARGVGVAGCPGFLIGWNRHVAWGITALGADQADLFRLKMTGRDRYEYDGSNHSFAVSSEQILVKGGSPVNITLKESRPGPVVTPLVSDVKAGEEYALRAIPQWELAPHSIQAALEMLRARDAADFLQATYNWSGPSAHCLFGDAKGHIGYTLLAAIPLRSACSPLAGQIAQDGSSSRYDWIGIIPHELLPQVMNPAGGVLYSANHLPVGNWYPISLGIGTGGTGDTVRSWRLRERLAETGPALFTPQDVLAIHYDAVQPARREIVRAGLRVRDLQARALSASAAEALRFLESWHRNGARVLTSDPYAAIAYHLRIQFRNNDSPALTAHYGGGEGGLSHWLKSLKQRLDQDPKAALSQDEIDYINTSLASAYDTVVRNYGSDPNVWQNRFASASGAAAVPYHGTLEGFGTLDRRYDPIFTGLLDTDGGTLWSQKSQSYSQWVNLGDVNSSLSLLPVGLSEDPASPHFKDQGALWVAGELHPAPLDENIVESLAEKTTLLTFTPAPKTTRRK